MKLRSMLISLVILAPMVFGSGAVFAQPDTTAPVISDVAVSDITASSATITWTTDEDSDSVVNYGTDTSLGSTESDSTLVTSHSITLTGLDASTEYHYTVTSSDADSNSASSADATFTTAAPDTTAPVISDVAVSDITASSATITWTTDEDSDSVVNYGTDTSLGSTESDSTLVMSHSITLTGLSAETEYLFEVESTDGSANTARDDNEGSFYIITTTEGTPVEPAEEEEGQKAFPGVVESYLNGSVTLAKQGTGELITISLEDYDVSTAKTPGGPRAGTFEEGARVVIKAAWVDGQWVAEWVLVKPTKPPHPLVGVVVGVQDSVVTVRRHNGETGSMQLPPGAELPVVGETVTIFQGLQPGTDGEVEEGDAIPMAKGLVKASKVRERLQHHLAELTAEDGQLPEGKARGRAKLVERLSLLLENHGVHHLQLLDGGLSRASGQVKAAIQSAKDRTVKGQQEARAAAERAKGKARAALPVSGAGGQGNGAGPPEQDESVRAEPVRGKPVKVNGKDMKLWVFVYPEKGGKGKKPPKDDDGPSLYCTDGDQSASVLNFANANPNGLSFNINDGSIPGDKAAAIEAIRGSFDAWDSVSEVTDYFTANDTGGASRPAADGNNTVGWVKIVPRNVLAAAWVWVDASTGNVEQADVFYNAFHKWGVFTACDAEGKFEVRNVGTHEVGHVVGLDHLSDADAYATMYPSASKGEVRKQTLTSGDAAGYLAVGGK